jgi:hypothetical protein
MPLFLVAVDVDELLEPGRELGYTDPHGRLDSSR